jgi:radical SAM protein with 4Fe4S-binding SPASM domain
MEKMIPAVKPVSLVQSEQVLAENSGPARRKTFVIQYEVNDACNLRCSHCYHGLKAIKESAVGLERLFQDLEELHTFLGKDTQILIRLSGGEVFLRKDLMAMLVKIMLKGYATVMLTNGTLVTPENALSVAVRGVDFVQISLDGPNSEVHDAIRGKGQFMKALEGIRHLIAEEQDVSVSYTLMQGHNDTRAHFEEILALAQKENFAKVNFSRIFPQGDAHNLPAFAYADGLRFKQTLQDLLAAAAAFPTVKVVIKDPLINNLEEVFPDNVKTDVCCYIRKNYISVTANGDVFACRKLSKSVGSLLNDTLLNIWQNNELLQQLDNRRQYMAGKCRTCPINDQCKGGCLAASYGLTQTLFVPDPACWREEVPV